MENGNAPIHILIAGDQHAFRQRLHRIFASEPGFCVDGEAADGRSVISLVYQFRPRVILLDAALPLRSELPRLNRVTGMSTYTFVMLPSIDGHHLIDALRLEARGMALKRAEPSQLLKGLREVAAGNYFLGAEVLPVLVQMVRDFLGNESVPVQHEQYSLTPREMEIIAKIASGLSNKAVAREFAISERTVKHHLTNIFNKIGVSNRLALALFAVNHQIMDGRAAREANPGDADAASLLNGKTVSCLPD